MSHQSKKRKFRGKIVPYLAKEVNLGRMTSWEKMSVAMKHCQKTKDVDGKYKAETMELLVKVSSTFVKNHPCPWYSCDGFNRYPFHIYNFNLVSVQYPKKTTSAYSICAFSCPYMKHPPEVVTTWYLNCSTCLIHKIFVPTLFLK